MVPTCTTRMGRRVLFMTISCVTRVGWRWSIPVLHGWAEHDHFPCNTGRPEMVHTGTTRIGRTWPFPVPYRPAGDGAYQYYTGGPKGAPDDHSLCHTGWLKMEHYLHDFSVVSNQCHNEINWLTSKTQSISNWASVSISQLADSTQSWSQSPSRMYPHLLEFLHGFSKASSQCYNWIIEINWIIERTWSITARIAISVWCYRSINSNIWSD